MEGILPNNIISSVRGNSYFMLDAKSWRFEVSHFINEFGVSEYNSE